MDLRTWYTLLPMLLCHFARGQTVSGPVPVAVEDNLLLTDGVIDYQLLDAQSNTHNIRIDSSRIDLLQNDLITG